MDINEILSAYTEGSKTLEDANAALKALGAGFHLDPTRNSFTPEEIAAARGGETPADANGYGLLDTGTGTLDKVLVEDGKLVNCDCGEMHALCIIGGKTYKVQGNTLVEG